jgi:hypothetical protein
MKREKDFYDEVTNLARYFNATCVAKWDEF